MNEVISTLTNTFTLAFVVTSMFSLGLAMTVKDILEPFRNLRLIILMVVANFVIMPLGGLLISRILSLEADLQIAVLLVSCVAGAPLTIKASQIARGDMKSAGTLVVLQVVITVISVPFILPLLIPGIQVDVVAIALPLIVQIFLPLAAGILMNYRYDEEAEMTRPIMGEISNISLGLMLVLNLGNIGKVLALLGTGSILAVTFVIVLGFVSGYLLGGPNPDTRKVLSIGTGQRNYAAAFVLAGGNFAEQPNVFLLLLSASLISMILVMLLAGEFRKRAGSAEQPLLEAVPEKG